MAYPKEWNSKPVVAAYPYILNGKVVCHNCYVSKPKGSLNACTGLCDKCVEQNPVKVPEVRERRLGGRRGRECKKCLQPLKYTNFGICRPVCRNCMVDHPLRQRCLTCRRYRYDCWNNVCGRCRDHTELLCENVGRFFVTSLRHDRVCWCVVDEEIRALRRDINTPVREEDNIIGNALANPNLNTM